MFKKVTTVALAVSLSGTAALWAVERATFILTSSERVSGPVVFHGDNRENLINGFLNLGASNGKEHTFPIDQVAVIDFIGGTPSNQELAALPASGHQLVLRNGTARTGQFVNIIGGDTVKWRESDGAVRDLPIGEVARIYLNTGSARNTFNFTATTTTAAAATTSLTAGGNGLTVKADSPWNDTGIVVQRGQALRFSVRGEIKYAKGGTDIAGAGGVNGMKSPNYPVPTLNGGGLIGKVGNSAPFAIGASQNSIVMPEDGTLMLGVNDDDTSDNSGAFFVTIVRGATRR